MYEISIDNQVADLATGQSLELKRFNPIFDLSTIRGGLINDFTLPFTRVNDKIFGWAREAQVPLVKSQFYCEQKADGLVVEKGTLELVDIAEDGYVVAFTSNYSEFFGRYHNTLLNKIDFGSEAVPAAPVKAADHINDSYCWPTVANADFYGTNTQAGWNGYMNQWDGTTLNAHARVPMLFMRWVWEQLATLCEFSFEGAFFESDVYKRGVFFNTFSIDDRSTITYQNHLPELTVVGLVLELKKLFGLRVGLDVKKRIVRLDFIQPYFEKGAEANYTTKIKPVNARSPEQVTRLKLDWQVDGNDGTMKVLPADMEAYESAGTTQPLEITSAFSTCITDGGVAKVEMEGNTGRFGQGEKSFAPRLLLWNGDGVALRTYGSWNLAWSGANNIHEKCWGNYEAWRSNTSKKVVPAVLNAVDLINTSWHENTGAVDVVYSKGKEYYVAEVSVILPLEGVAELVLWERNL